MQRDAGVVLEVESLVSILYEANEVCNRPRAVMAPMWAKFQSSTRLTRFATRRAFTAAGVALLVSILYEANEVCNGPLQEAAPGGGS